MKWRPETWSKINPNLCDGCSDKQEDEYGLICAWWCHKHTVYLLIESGADAILEALFKEEGVRITQDTMMVTQPIFERKNGWLVFIPDEGDNG